MQGIMWSVQSELEEWAYRWKSGRLQDDGFPDYYDALAAYRIVDAVPALAPGGVPNRLGGRRTPKRRESCPVMPGA